MSETAKPTTYLAVLGESGHGKTALTNALVSVLARWWPGSAQGDRGPAVVDPPCARWLQVFGTDCVGFATARRRYVQLDCGGTARFARVLPGILAATRPDAALLVVSAFEGVTPTTHAHLRAARDAGIATVACYVSHADREEAGASSDVAEQDAREALAAAGYDGDAAPVVSGASPEAGAGDAVWTPRLDALIELLDALPLASPRADALRFAAPLRVSFACAYCGARVSREVSAFTGAERVRFEGEVDEEFDVPDAQPGAVALNLRRRGYLAQPGDLVFDPRDVPDLARLDSGEPGWGDPQRVDFACAGRDVTVRGWAVGGTVACVVVPRGDVVPIARLEP